MNYQRLIAIVVVYNQNLEKSETLASLNKAVKEGLDVIIYDNSTESSKVNLSLFDRLNIRYFHNPSNPGICAAYNFGFNEASKSSKDWMLLLDQDTVLSDNYFDCLSISLKGLDSNIVSIVPNVTSKLRKRILSPLKIYAGGFLRSLEIKSGIISDRCTAINSASLVNIKFIYDIGGFNETFKLDMLDYWFYREVYNKGKQVLLLDTEIIHDLSVDDFNTYMSIKRYKELLISEQVFFGNDGMISYMLYKFRLVVRSFKFLSISKFSFAKYTFTNLLKV